MTVGEVYLTVSDANLRLPLVRAIVKDAVELKSDMLDRQERLAELRDRYPEEDSGSPYFDEVVDMEESVEADEDRIEAFARELKQVGASLVDAESGLVEFASTLGGATIRLSWKFDEPQVSYWRSDDELPTDRRPLELTEQSAG